MTEVKIKRSQFQTFLNITPTSTATYKLIGNGVAAAAIEYNPEVKTEKYIDRDVASNTVDSYAPKIPVEQMAIQGDDVFDYIEALAISMAIMSDVETDIVNVRLYETGGPTAYPATKQPVVISIDKYGGPGGEAMSIGYTLNYNGTPTQGHFNASTKVFS